ncbi:DUF3310 domain-containing protein [Streptomyces sp. NPDC094438]|uniref:DUF3310 domain-containing protein n=1 Tax=Streptomyces sp. NPDC094438 TaxID=3366061 RepID=UPI00380E51EC
MSPYSIGDWIEVNAEVYREHRHFHGKRGAITAKDYVDRYDGQAWRVLLESGGEITLYEKEMNLVDWNIDKSKPVQSSTTNDAVNSPSYYTQGYANGAEVIDIAEALPYNRGNAVKYLARARKKDNEIEDLRKALWYIKRELDRLGASA